MRREKDPKSAIQALVDLGYTVKLSKPTTKKTFEVEIETLETFVKLQKSLGIKVKEAIREALNDWISKKSES